MKINFLSFKARANNAMDFVRRDAVLPIFFAFVFIGVCSSGAVAYAFTPTFYFNMNNTTSEIMTNEPMVVLGHNLETYIDGLPNLHKAITNEAGTAMMQSQNSYSFGVQDMTMWGWFMTTSTITGPQNILRIGTAGTGHGIAFYNYGTPNDILCDWGGNTVHDVASPSNFNDGQWHLIVCTRDNTNSKLYYDGVLLQTHARANDNLGTDTFQVHGTDSTGSSINHFDDLGIVLGTAISASDVSNLWNGGAGNEANATSSGGIAKVTPQFLYPYQGISSPPFDYWLFYVPDMQLSHTYRAQVTWSLPGYTSPITTDALNFVTHATGTETFLVPVVHNNFYVSVPVATTTELASVKFYDLELPGFPLVGSSSISFVYVATNTKVYTDLSFLHFTTSTLQNSSGTLYEDFGFCTPPSDITDWGGGLKYSYCWALNTLFNSNHSDAFARLSVSWSGFKSTFPFGTPFQLYDLLQSAVSSTAATTTAPVVSVHIPYSLWSVATSSRTIVIYSVAVANDVWLNAENPAQMKADWFDMTDMISVLVFVGVVYWTIRPKKHKKK